MKWFPVSYCQFCIENKSFEAGKLYTYLKYHSDGITDRSLLEGSRIYFGVSAESIRRWKNMAKEFNWIGENKGLLYIRSWQYLFDSLRFQKKACYRFRIDDLKDFRTYCYAAVISYMARAQAKKLERLSGRSNQASACVPLAVSAIAKTLNVSHRTAQTYRQKAVDAGYIRKRENLKPFHIKVEELPNFRKFSPYSEDRHLVVRRKKGRLQVFEQLPDMIHVDREEFHSPRRWKIGQNWDSPFSGSIESQTRTLPPVPPE